MVSPLRRIRRERGLSQDDVARRVPQVSTTAIRAFDRGESIPRGRTLILLARGLGVSVEDLLEGIEIEGRKEKATPQTEEVSNREVLTET
jgi:transcriptional regulator with XRE-family HTH domain